MERPRSIADGAQPLHSEQILNLRIPGEGSGQRSYFIEGLYGEQVMVQMRGNLEDPNATTVWFEHGSPGTSDDPMFHLDKMYTYLYLNRIKIVSVNRDGYWHSSPLPPDIYPNGRIEGVAKTIQHVAKVFDLPLKYALGRSGGSRYALALGSLIPGMKGVATLGGLAPMSLFDKDDWYAGM